MSRNRYPSSATFNATALFLVFVVTLTYTGAGFNLHRLSLTGLLLFLWIAFLISKLDLSRLRLSWGWLPWVVLAYLIWLLISPLISNYPYASSTTGFRLALLPFVFIAWQLVPRNAKDQAWHSIWLFIVFSLIVLSIWGISDLFLHHERARASFLDTNAYAGLINLVLVPLAYFYLTGSGSPFGDDNPRLALFTIAILALAQASTLSRGGLIAFLAVLPALFWWTCRHATFRSRLPWLLGVLVAAHVAVQAAPGAPRAVVETIAPTTEDGSVHSRMLLLESTWKMLGDSNLLYGNGIGTFKTYYSAYRLEGEDSYGNFVHNDYLQGLFEGGIIQLGFLTLLTVVAPIWLLFSRRSRKKLRERSHSSDTPGLVLGVCCISIHALVNFIHYVGPIAVLTGLYLAHAWEEIEPTRRFNLQRRTATLLNPKFSKGLVIFLLAIPTTVLLMDGVIFKLFATDHPISARMSPDARLAALNLALTVRPGDPIPRIFLIRGLLTAAEQAQSQENRNTLLTQAQRETTALAETAPALALGRYFYPGRIRVLRGDPGDLIRARSDFEQAVKSVPSSTRMRLELIKVYQRLGQQDKAYQAIRDARKWVRLEVDMSALAEFANTARSVALQQSDLKEAKYWAGIQARLNILGYAS